MCVQKLVYYRVGRNQYITEQAEISTYITEQAEITKSQLKKEIPLENALKIKEADKIEDCLQMIIVKKNK